MLEPARNSKRSGFTIIEFMIIISMISLLSTALILANRGEEKKMSLQISALKLVQDMREIQEMAMGAKEKDCGGAFSSSFGLYFLPAVFPNSYLVFVDCNGNRRKDSSDIVLREIKLEKGIIVYDISPSPLDVVFLPPEPATYINGVSQDAEAVITFALETDPGRPENQKIIRINSVGRMEME